MFKAILIKEDVTRFRAALRNIKQEAKRELEIGGGSFNRLCAIDYNQLIIKNIFGRATPTPPYSAKYAKWKKKHSLMGYPSPWRLTGNLVRAINIFQYNKGWASGVQAYIYSDGRLVPPEEIASYGSREEARRPIFKPTMQEYSASGTREGRINKLLGNIASKWR